MGILVHSISQLGLGEQESCCNPHRSPKIRDTFCLFEREKKYFAPFFFQLL